MSFLRANFTPIGGQSKGGNGGAMSLYGYKTDDAHAVVDGAGYFNDLSDILYPGDIIWVVVLSSAIGASPEVVTTYGHHLVLTNAAGVVDCTNVTVGLMTDTD